MFLFSLWYRWFAISKLNILPLERLVFYWLYTPSHLAWVQIEIEVVKRMGLKTLLRSNLFLTTYYYGMAWSAGYAWWDTCNISISTIWGNISFASGNSDLGFKLGSMEDYQNVLDLYIYPNWIFKDIPHPKHKRFCCCPLVSVSTPSGQDKRLRWCSFLH